MQICIMEYLCLFDINKANQEEWQNGNAAPCYGVGPTGSCRFDSYLLRYRPRPDVSSIHTG